MSTSNLETLRTRNRRAATAMVVAWCLPPGIVLGALCLLISPVTAVVVLVILSGGLAWWVWTGVETQILRRLGGTDATPVDQARLINLVDGLCVSAGLPKPRLVVVDDPAANVLTSGRRPERALLAVTTGLLEQLSRIELEGVLAEALVTIKQLDILPATIAVMTRPIGRRFLARSGTDTETDLAAVSLTRYPPGLLAAFERMSAAGVVPAKGGPVLAPLWLLADPGDTTARREPLSERMAALREL